MEERLKKIIAAHNRMIDTINAAEMTCNLFRGMEVWHKIACEGADITSAARSVGIDAKVNMQSGVITVLEHPTVLEHSVGKIPATDAFIKSGMTLDEIISNLRDQVDDRESSVDKDDPDCIFRRDAAALRVAVELLEGVKVQND